MLSPSIRLFSRQKSSPLLIRTFATSGSRIKTRSDSTFLRTLRPDHIVESGQAIVDLSGLTRKSITVPFEHPRWPSPCKIGAPLITLTQQSRLGRKRKPFPANTRGFFYYRPGITVLAGSVRFRLCDSAATFESGRDLARNDRIWQPQLIDIVSSPTLRRLIPLLLAEQLVDESVLVEMDQFHISPMHAPEYRFYSFRSRSRSRSTVGISTVCSSLEKAFMRTTSMVYTAPSEAILLSTSHIQVRIP